MPFRNEVFQSSTQMVANLQIFGKHNFLVLEDVQVLPCGWRRRVGSNRRVRVGGADDIRVFNRCQWGTCIQLAAVLWIREQIGLFIDPSSQF